MVFTILMQYWVFLSIVMKFPVALAYHMGKTHCAVAVANAASRKNYTLK